MQITIELPDDIAHQLQPGDISRRVLELIAADHYRQGQIGAAEVRRMLNFSSRPQLEPVSHAPQSDCLWLGAPEPEDSVQGIQDLITDLLPSLGFDPASEVQVLCPMTRGVVGTRNLNTVLQQLINPPSPAKAELLRGGMTLRVGDRVIQKVNDYDREVFNGDLGVIAAIDVEEQEVTVNFAERSVSYDYADLNEIALAWAVTIHARAANIPW